jgi:hypothetical protein
MKNVFFISVLFLAAFFSCIKKDNTTGKVSRPTDLISADEMKKILVDAFLAEIAISIDDQKHKNAFYYAWHYYNYVFKKHNISYAQFQRNYSYYSSDSKQMTQIMTNVIDDLSQLQSKVKNE